MAATRKSRILITAAMALCLVGVIDSILARAWDHGALFGSGLLLLAATLVRRHPGRRTLTLRADLGAWLSSRSELTGEPEEVLADRAVAAHRAGLLGREDLS